MGVLEGKKAVITGSTAGIGKAIALNFAKEGALVAIVGTNEQNAKEVAQEIHKIAPHSQVKTLLMDVSNYQKVEEGITSLLSDWNTIDVLVNNAGITRDNLLLRMTEEEWDLVMDVNVKSMFNVTKQIIRTMIKNKKGKIINISSVIGLIGATGQVNYAASKAAVIGFTKALAKEVAKKNICVNCIAPGYIETKMTQVLSEETKKAIIEMIPMQRIGQVEDIAKAAVFLAGQESDYITGQVLTVDGGMVM